MRQLKFLIILVLIASAFIYLQNHFNFLNITVTDNEPQKEEKLEQKSDRKDYVEIYTDEGENLTVNVELAKTETERRLGLSNRKYLGSYDGMWFMFEEDVSNSFWMKDCLIPLDIIFVDSSGFIVDIKDNNEPCTEKYCPSISPSSPYRNVLEVNANFASNHGIKVGHSIKTYFTEAD